jgi:hypothetical protein
MAAQETRPGVIYEAAFVGLNVEQEGEKEAYLRSLSPSQRYSLNWFGRSSAWRAANIKSFDQKREFFNSGAEIRTADRRLSVDDYASSHSRQVDFLKIDTDGAEMDVLYGADRTLRSSVLGVHIEYMFQGANNRYANSLSNIDRYLSDRGFAIYAMQSLSYTRAALPGPFHYEMMAQTNGGQLAWADVVFLRDLAVDETEHLFDFAATPERVLKLACLMETFELNDCAAELLLKREKLIPYPIKELLDRLVPTCLGNNLTYEQDIECFEADPHNLLPLRQANPQCGLAYRQKCVSSNQV